MITTHYYDRNGDKFMQMDLPEGVIPLAIYNDIEVTDTYAKHGYAIPGVRVFQGMVKGWSEEHAAYHEDAAYPIYWWERTGENPFRAIHRSRQEMEIQLAWLATETEAGFADGVS